MKSIQRNSIFTLLLSVIVTLNSCGNSGADEMDKMIQQAQEIAKKEKEEREKEQEERKANLKYYDQSVGDGMKMKFTAPFKVKKEEIPMQDGLSSIDFRQCSRDDGAYTFDFVASASTLKEGYEYDALSGVEAAVQALEVNPNIAGVNSSSAEDVKIGDVEGKKIKGYYVLTDSQTISFEALVFFKDGNIFQVIGQYRGLAKDNILSTIASISFE